MSFERLLNYFHPAGWPFMAIGTAVTFLAFCIGGTIFWVCLILTAWVFYFFRDPVRTTPARAGLIVSPADGKVVAIREIVPEEELDLGEEPRICISIFLNVFNVHVNRMPADGIVKACRYRPGKFFNASLDKASLDNERMAITLQMTGDHPYDNASIGVVQIAGLVARRIVCDAKEGYTYRAGERFGIIRFGSRADVYLPAGVAPLVCIGQTAVGGETVLADCASDEPGRQAALRI